MSNVNPLDSQHTSAPSSGTTSNGTKIIKQSEAGGAMDKDAFLKILCAELQNIDPTQDQDSSQYVAQMAQFSSIEQMDNLNNTLTKSSYQGLIGKGVAMSDTDDSGKNYAGLVQSVYTDSNNNTMITLEIEGSDGSLTTKDFNAEDIMGVTDSGASSATESAVGAAALSSSFLAASALTGKPVTVSTTDSDGKATQVSGTMKSAYINNGQVMIKVTTSDGTTKEYPFASVVKAGDYDSDDSESATNNSASA
ncbi:flagellar hook capping FlgD N-terminal domain-containing protein [Clostridium sp. BL-8]|uniref:flagellar hook capping FlgD N-terminal domain-containing protein n=1 Tax=Clostridium sp. BL-8 TaxID=349938 RepID=UPI00098BE23D|nr:flagellar hook capping FlgD N-terminal domain-containing protein [Clostridium sp. BL-8]OOM79937.1 flagellar basal body rod modification protein [Clostridium sp. BL-8]